MSEVTSKVDSIYMMAYHLASEYIGKQQLTTIMFQDIARDYFGSNISSGAYDRTDMYNALELAFNMWAYGKKQLFENYPKLEDVRQNYSMLRDAVRNVPTQTVRSEEQLDFQQFSTPPHLAYLAAWVSNIRGGLFLEPSAGLGGLGIHGIARANEVVLNEVYEDRRNALEALVADYDRVQVQGFDALNLHAFMPTLRPDTVLMNPPFSVNGPTGYKSKFLGMEHMQTALKMCANGGRVVAILYGGRPNFKGDQGGVSMYNSDYQKFWDNIRYGHTIRANVSFPGTEYMKYGTGINTRLIVIDKIGPHSGTTITHEFKDNDDIMENFFKVMEPVRLCRYDKSIVLGNEHIMTFPTIEPQHIDLAAELEKLMGRKPDAILDVEPPKVASTFTRREVTQELLEKVPEPKEVVQICGTEISKETEVVNGRTFTTTRTRLSYERTPLQPSTGFENEPVANEPVADNEPAAPFTISPPPTYVEISEKEFFNASPAGQKAIADAQVPKEEPEPEKESSMMDMFVAYKPYLQVTGTKGHPSPLVESDTLRLVHPPKVKTKVRLPFQAVRDGKISDVQIETVALAIDSNSRTLPQTGLRTSFILGQGTGFGKGTTLATSAMHYWLGGARKILWMSKSADLINDAKRDWKWIGGNEADIFLINDQKKSVIERTGIMFSTYTTIGLEQQAKKADPNDPTRQVMKGIDRLEQVVKWKPDVIMLDESHLLSNSLGLDAANMAVRGIQLCETFPDVPVIMASATAATEVENLAYATDRLGLSGPHMGAFPSKEAFIHKIGSAGMLGMELVAKEMKVMGKYMSQNLSYQGTTFRMMEHTLTEDQVYQYNTAAEAWRLVMEMIEDAALLNKADKSTTMKKYIKSQYYGAMQRFFNQLLTSMKTPAVIEDMEKALESGHSCVIQLVNTNEAATGRAVAEASAQGLSLDEMDISPKDTLIGVINSCFPTTLYQYVQDEKGKVTSEPVKDKDGKFVVNPVAVEMKNDLIRRVYDLRIPEGALDMIINWFGHDKVAEVSGRKERFVTKKGRQNGDLGASKERQARSKNSCNAEALEFNERKRRILIFSGAGNTGRSFHADKRIKNQDRRMHYVLQPGWRADEALQGLGRTHRTNQSSAPEYVLPTTNLKGEKRFITSIARRIEQLGSLTKGNRKAASGGLFSGEDNLESKYATEANHLFFQALKQNLIEGLTLKQVLTEMGLKDMMDEHGHLNQKKMPKTTQFLNRLLCLNTNVQDKVFDEWFKIIRSLIEQAIENGTFDKGVEKLSAQTVTKVMETDVYTDPENGAVTKIVELQLLNPTRSVSVAEAMKGKHVSDTYEGYSEIFGEEFYAFVKSTIKAGPNTGEVRPYVVLKSAVRFDKNGAVVRTFRKISPFGSQTISEADYLGEGSHRIERKELEELWKTALSHSPEFESNEIYLITGALLPIWDKIPNNYKARIVAAETTLTKERMLGRVIPVDDLHDLLSNLGAMNEGEYYTSEELLKFVVEKDAKLVLANKWRIQKRRTAGEDRIIIIGITNPDFIPLRDAGHMKHEFIGQNLYYIPMDGNEVEHFEAITYHRRVVQMDRNGLVTNILAEKPTDEPKAVKEFVEEADFFNIDHLIELVDMETKQIRPVSDLLIPYTEEVKAEPAKADLFTAPAPAPKKEQKLSVKCEVPNLIPMPSLALPSEKKAAAPEAKADDKPMSQKEKLQMLIKKAHAKNASIDANERKPRKVVELEAAGQMSLF